MDKNKMGLNVDRFASLAFSAFVFIEWQVGESPTAWRIRLLWLLSTFTGIYVLQLRERQAVNGGRIENEGSIERKGMPEKANPAEPSPIKQGISREVSSFESSQCDPTISFISSNDDTKPSPRPEGNLNTPSPPAVLKRKSKSFLRKPISILGSFRRKSPRSEQADNSGITLQNPSPSPRSSTGRATSSMPTSPVAPSDTSHVATPKETNNSSECSEAPSRHLTANVADAFGFGPEAIRPPDTFVYTRKSNWGYLDHLTSEQSQALNELRAKDLTCIEAKQPDPGFVVDDETLLRFLRARKFDVGKAERMLRSHLAWRDKFLPSKLTPNDIASVLGSGLSRFGPYSRDGLPSTMIKVEFFDPTKFEDVDDFSKYVAFFFERAADRLPRGGDKGILFFDMKGWSIRRHANRHSMKLIAELINIIQAHNPERLDKCILFNTPLIFSGAWSIIKGWLDPVVADKVMFVSDTSVVLELFDPEVLPVEYGGKRILPYPIEGYASLHPISTTT